MEHYIIDCQALHSKEDLHQHLAQTLSFPDWYGGNLDALYDCLCAITGDTGLTLENFQALKERLGDYAGKLLYVLHDAEEETPNLSITVKL